MNNLNADERIAAVAAARSTTPRRKKQAPLADPAKRAGTRNSGKPVPQGKTKSKKEQLIELLSKPNGARVSMLIERLGWQSHTVRAALSGLRKQDFKITTTKSAKGGEAVYAMVSAPSVSKAKSGKAKTGKAPA